MACVHYNFLCETVHTHLFTLIEHTPNPIYRQRKHGTFPHRIIRDNSNYHTQKMLKQCGNEESKNLSFSSYKSTRNCYYCYTHFTNKESKTQK